MRSLIILLNSFEPHLWLCTAFIFFIIMVMMLNIKHHLHIWWFSCNFWINNLKSRFQILNWQPYLIFLLQFSVSLVGIPLLVLEIHTFRFIWWKWWKWWQWWQCWQCWQWWQSQSCDNDNGNDNDAGDDNNGDNGDHDDNDNIRCV